MKRHRGRVIRVLLFALLIPVLFTVNLLGGGPSGAQAAPALAPGYDFLFGAPAYDSGWTVIGGSSSITFTHSLGGSTDGYYVVLDARNSGALSSWGNSCYGTDFTHSGEAVPCGFFWYGLTSTEIRVGHGSDLVNNEVRVRIWRPGPADYDSGWTTASLGNTQTFDHELGGNPEDYLVYLEFRNALYSVHHVYYGVDTVGPAPWKYRGGFWRSLTNTGIKVWTGSDSGAYIDDIRVRIWRVRDPAYDSGWVDVAAGDHVTLDHNLGGPWNDFVIDMQFKDTAASPVFGTHAYRVGGDCYGASGSPPLCEGAFYTEFFANKMVIVRRTNDSAADQVRVRIWERRLPKFGTRMELEPGAHSIVAHSIGGDPDDYVVDLQFTHVPSSGSGGVGVNQIAFGGDDTCEGTPPATHAAGVYWRALNNSSIDILRGGDDNTAGRVHLRIWAAPPADYDSGWHAIARGDIETLTHSVGGSTDDYVVYLEFKDIHGSGVNQQAYGGDLIADECGITTQVVGGDWLQLTPTTVRVRRRADDPFADEMRIRIWKNPTSDYASTWSPLGPGGALTLEHNLNWPPESMISYMTFHDTAVAGKGVHHQYYGGDAYVGDPPGWAGAYWALFTPTSIRVSRLTNDQDVDEVRMRIWEISPLQVMLPLIAR